MEAKHKLMRIDTKVLKRQRQPGDLNSENLDAISEPY